MTYEDSLREFGLVPKDEDLPRIRELLAHEAECQRKGGKREGDLALLCCVQLFSKGQEQDILRIWDAKSSGVDLFSYLDVQFLCGSGLQSTEDFLRRQPDKPATDALTYLEECKAAGDFEEFSPTEHLERYRAYFGFPL